MEAEAAVDRESANHLAESRTLQTLLACRDTAYRFALRMVGEPGAAEDVVQQAYVQALIQLGRGRLDGEGARSWFLRVVSNAAKSHLRSEGARRRREAAMATPVRDDAPAGQELVGPLRVALSALDPRLRAPIVLCYENGLSQTEAAEVLELSQATVSERIQAGLERLRKALARAGYPAAVAAVLGGLKATAPVVPASLASRVEALVAHGAMKAGTATAAASASAAVKGGIAMKAIAGVLVAGALAGAVAVSTGMMGGASPAVGDGKPAPVNPYNGMQEREEIYEFTQKPSVKKEGDKWVITFASKGKCDATVSILDKDGRIIRHLASGVLGKNAPDPFQQNSLSQRIEWDGLTDGFKKAPAGCKVKVSLGLKARFDKNIAYDPYCLPEAPLVYGTRDPEKKYQTPLLLVASGDGGTVYVGSRFNNGGTCNVRAFGKDAKYLRTVYPPPAEALENFVAQTGSGQLTPTRWGDLVPVVGAWCGAHGDTRSATTPQDRLPDVVKAMKAQPEVREVLASKRPKELPAPSVPGSEVTASPGNYVHLAVDRTADLLYVYAGGHGVLRFTGEAGTVDKSWLPGLKNRIAPGMAPSAEISVAPDGVLYMRAGRHGYGRAMFRMDRGGKPVPFKKEYAAVLPPPELTQYNEWYQWLPEPFKGVANAGVYCGTVGWSNVHQCGLYAAPNGMIVTGIKEISAKWAKETGLVGADGKFADGYQTKIKLDADSYWKGGLTDRMNSSFVPVFDADGKLLTPNSVGFTYRGHGVAMDRDGNIYAVFGECLPAGQPSLDGIADPKLKAKWNGYGSLVKFRGQGGKYPLTTGPGIKMDLPRKNESTEMAGALWAYGGLVGQKYGSCTCSHTRHDMDFFARSWIPANHLCSIVVLDSNGNRIVRLGRYGNVDDSEADVKAGRDGLRFAWPRAVAVSDAALYVADQANVRILRAALSYHAEETVPLDGSASSGRTQAPARGPAGPAAPPATPRAESTPEEVCRGLFSLAMSYKRAGRRDRARAYLEKIIAQHPTTDYAARARRDLAGL